ncbi:MAG: sulfatase [Opitutaceae bacterium]
MKKAFALVFGLLVHATLAAERPRPNVLFICADDMRPWLGCYGQPRAITPHMDTLAAAGVRFDSAHCQFALCMPSRTSLLSGLRPDEAGRQIYLSTGEGSLHDPNQSIRHLRPDIVTLPQYLRQQGWRTVSIGKVGHDWDERGFDEYRLGPAETYNEFEFYVLPESRAKLKDKSLNLPPRGIPFEAADRADIEYNDTIIAADTVTTLQRLKARGEPFFLAVGLFRPHMPLVCPKRYWDRYPADQMVLATNLKQPADVGPFARFSGPTQTNWKYYRFPEKADGSVDEVTMRDMIRGYLACITFVDVQIGQILDELKAEGLDKNTIVVLWSDNGYHLGEHGEWNKVTNYEEGTRVPLIIVDPAAPHAGRVVSQPVELLDLYPTFCDLLGLPKPKHLEGESLLPLLRGEPGRVRACAVSIIVRSALRDLIPEIDDAVGWSLRTARYRYTVWFDGRTKQILQRELFDHDTDPGENKNLSGDPAHAAIMNELHEKLLREYIEPQRKAAAVPRPSAPASS